MLETMKLKKATYHLYTFLISKMISSLGSNVYAFGMSMFILAITGSALSFAANMIFSIVPRLIFSPIAGILSDRLPKKMIVLAGQGGTVLSIGCLLIYSLMFDLSITAIYITSIFYSISTTFSSIAFTSSIANLVDSNRIQKAMSFNQLSLSIAGIGGPIVGGMLFGFVSIELFLLFNVVAYIITLVLEATMDFKLYSNETSQKSEKEPMLQSFKEGIQYLKTKPIISRIILLVLILNFFFSCIAVGFQFILVKLLHVDFTHIGFIEAGTAIGMMVISIYLATRSTIKYPLLFSKWSIIGLSLLVSTFAIPLIFSFSMAILVAYYFIVSFLFGSFSVLTNTPFGTIMHNEIDEDYRGRVFGILDTVAMGLMPLGSLIFGLLYDKIPAQYILIFCSISLIIVTLVLLSRSIIQNAYPEIDYEMESTSIYTKNDKKLLKNEVENNYADAINKVRHLSNSTTSPY